MPDVVDKECLRRNYTFVTHEIDALELVDHLVDSEAITLSDRTRIVNIKSNIDRNSELVSLILKNKSEYVLYSFLQSLEPKYQHVLDKLQKQDVSGVGDLPDDPNEEEKPGIELHDLDYEQDDPNEEEKPGTVPYDVDSEQGAVGSDSKVSVGAVGSDSKASVGVLVHAAGLALTAMGSALWVSQARDHMRILKDKKEKEMDKIRKLKAEREKEMDKILKLKAEREKVMNEMHILKAETDTSAEYIKFTARANTPHKKFLPFIDFSLNHLPACYQHDEMRNLIKSLAELTVKIEVKDVHEKREKFWKDKRHFFDQESNSKNIILGSGKVEDVTLYSEKDGACPCRCQKCKSVPKQKWGEIKILTSAQLLYDEKDAKRFVCTLFYDDETSHTITIIGEKIVVKNTENDICIFTSVTCDLDLIACLESMLDTFEECWENAFDRYIYLVKWEVEKLIVLVSHPLGYKKHISIGKKLDYKQDLELKGINYDVPTLPGSRGAFLLVPDFDVVNKNVKVL